MPLIDKYTEARLDKLARAIRLGSTYVLACKHAGISYSCFRRWMVDAENNPETSKYKSLPALVAEAEGDAAVQWLAIIEKAAVGGDWKAAAWKLERRYAEEYGRRTIIGGSLGLREDKDIGTEADAAERVLARLRARGLADE